MQDIVQLTHAAHQSLLALREVYGEQVIIQWPP